DNLAPRPHGETRVVSGSRRTRVLDRRHRGPLGASRALYSRRRRDEGGTRLDAATRSTAALRRAGRFVQGASRGTRMTPPPRLSLKSRRPPHPSRVPLSAPRPPLTSRAPPTVLAQFS